MRSKIKRKLRNNSFTWRNLLNFKSRIAYLFSRVSLSDEAKRVIDEMNRNGIAMTSCDSLLSDRSAYSELCTESSRLRREAEAVIEDARNHVLDAGPIGEKKFIHFLLGDKPEVNTNSVFARFALQKEILCIANAYMGLFSQLRYFNVWHTLANDGPARQSQLWHRDRDDYQTCKVFLYLNDVDEGAGPFTYAKGTHPSGGNHAEPEFRLEGRVRRSDDDQMERVAPRSSWVKATGKRGTIIFADTRGFHKGGEARTSDRIMYTCMFLSSASEVRELMTPPITRQTPSVDMSVRRALGRYRD